VSKHKPAIEVEAPKPAKLPLGELVGRTVECPDCGKPAEVGDARAAKHLSGAVITSRFWVKLHCTGWCGVKLHKATTTALPLDVPRAVPQRVELGKVVGHFCRCPQCGDKARAAWVEDLGGHAIDCPTCGPRSASPLEPVELLG
jgi:hypothetical protein